MIPHILLCSYPCYALEDIYVSRLTNGVCVQDTAENLARLQMDLVILVVLSAGNDYLPALVGGRLQGSSLWESYLTLKTNREWAHQCVPFLSGMLYRRCRRESSKASQLNPLLVILVIMRRPLATWRDGEVRLNAACLTALLKAWPRAQNKYLVSFDEDDVVVYKPAADPLRYLEVRILFNFYTPIAICVPCTHEYVVQR